MSTQAKIDILVREAVELRQRIDDMGLPRNDHVRRVLEYELTKLRLRIRDLKTIKKAEGPPARRLIPYAGYEEGTRIK